MFTSFACFLTVIVGLGDDALKCPMVRQGPTVLSVIVGEGCLDTFRTPITIGDGSIETKILS